MSAFPIILSAPSGGGKTTIARLLLEQRADVGYSVSCTTRTPRVGENHGKDYYFLSREAFEGQRERGDFAESATVHGHLYGTLRKEVERVLASGKHVIMDIDVQGARQFAAAFPQSVLIFIVPPSISVLIERLRLRATEDKASMARRLGDAHDELESLDFYQYVLVNDDLESAVRSVASIIEAESLRRVRNEAVVAKAKKLIDELDREISNQSER